MRDAAAPGQADGAAARLRNVSEACRHHGISRSQFYEYKRAFQERGLDGLLERPHRGYRNMGRRPIETIEAGKIVKEQLTENEAA